MGILDDAIREHLELKRRRGADPSEIAREEQEALGPARRTAEPLQQAPERDRETDAPSARETEDGGGREARGARDEPALDEPAAAYADEPVEEAPEDAPTALHAPVEPPAAPADADLEEDHLFTPPHGDDLFDDLPEEPEPESESEPQLERPPEREPEPPPEDPDLDNVGDPVAPAEAEPAPADDDVRPEDPLIDQPTEQFAARDVEEATAGEAEAADVVPADDEPEGEDLLEETPDFLEETPEHDRLWFEQKPPRDFDF